MGGGKKKSHKKPVGSSTVPARQIGTPGSIKPGLESATEQDAAQRLLDASLAHYSQPVDVLSSDLSIQQLKESDLCRKFDTFISSESSAPEVGIQSARDLFVEVARQQQIASARLDVLKLKKIELIEENKKMNEAAKVMAEETQKGFHQKEVLAALADELTKQKNVKLCCTY